jgi:hypothetical protein
LLGKPTDGTTLPWIPSAISSIANCHICSYPETAGKTLEEIEIMFQKGGPHPWHTKPGNSLLDAKIQEFRNRGKESGIFNGTEEGRAEYAEKTAPNGVQNIA